VYGEKDTAFAQKENVQIYSDTMAEYDYFRLEDLNGDGNQELIATGADGIYNEDGKYCAIWADVYAVIGGKATLTGSLGNSFFDELIVYDEEEKCMYTMDDSGSVDSLDKYYMDKNSHLMADFLVADDEGEDDSYMLIRYDLTDGAGPYESDFLEETEYYDLLEAWADRIAEHKPLSFEPKSKW
jgi:hypothetical protein